MPTLAKDRNGPVFQKKTEILPNSFLSIVSSHYQWRQSSPSTVLKNNVRVDVKADCQKQTEVRNAFPRGCVS